MKFQRIDVSLGFFVTFSFYSQDEAIASRESFSEIARICDGTHNKFIFTYYRVFPFILFPKLENFS